MNADKLTHPPPPPESLEEAYLHRDIHPDEDAKPEHTLPANGPSLLSEKDWEKPSVEEGDPEDLWLYK